MDIIKFINNPIFKWIPTLLFIALIGLGFLIGFLRGRKKTIVYFKQTLIIFIILFALYFFLVNTKVGDKFLLDIINQFFQMIYGYTIETYLGIEKCGGAKELILTYLPEIIPTTDIMSILIYNPSYLLTIVDLVFHIGFALILYVIYLVVKLIVSIIWLIFYSEKRYKLKINRKFSLGKVDRPYQKRRLEAGAISAFRSFLSSLLLFSILGTILFVATATSVQEPLDSDSLENEEVKNVATLYKGIETLGSEGIFKVLNSIKDNHNTPYYLLLCDVVFQGKLEDSTNKIDETIYFREEIGAYTELTKRTYNLVMKYKAKDINSFISGEESIDMTVILTDLFSDENFEKDFKKLINEFDSKTFFVNLVVSMLDSFVNTEDSFIFDYLTDEVGEILKILFKRGHLSDYIVDEKQIKEINANSDEKLQIKLPSLSISNLIEKRDFDVIYDIVNDLVVDGGLNFGYDDETNPEINYARRSDDTLTDDEMSDIDYEATFALIDKVVKHLSRLTLFQGAKRNQLSPVLGRMYAFCISYFLNETPSQISSNYQRFINSEVNWVDEVEKLIFVAKDALSVVLSLLNSTDLYEVLKGFFDPSNENYKRNVASFDLLLETVKTSKILPSILSQAFIFDTLIESISQLSPNMSIPEDIDFENKIVNGKEVYNEMYCLLKALRVISSAENSEILEILSAEDITTEDLLTIFQALTNKDSQNKSAVEYILDSKVLTSLISSIIIDYSESSELPLYIPTTSRKIDSNKQVTNIIKKDQLMYVLNNISKIFDIAYPIISGSGDVEFKDIINKLSQPEILSLFNNDIIAGTVSNVLITFMKGNGQIVLPKHLEEVESWIHPQDGELLSLLNCLTNTTIDIDVLLSGTNDDLMELITELTSEDVDTLLRSDIIYYTVSDILIDMSGTSLGDFTLIVPTPSKIKLTSDSINNVVKKEELKGILNNIKLLQDTTDVNSLLFEVIMNKDSILNNKIILATVVNYLVNSSNNLEVLTDGIIVLSDSLKNYAKFEKLNEFSQTNPWNNELRSLFVAIEELLDINKNNTTIDFENLETDLISELPNLNNPSKTTSGLSKLDVLTKSSIMNVSIASYIDIVFESLVKDKSDLEMAKQADGSYKKQELESIVNTITIFDIDLQNPDYQKIETKLKKDFLTFIDPIEQYNNDSVIDLIYDSVLIKTMLRETLDSILENVVTDILELNDAKDGYGCYTKDEIVKLINGFKTLDIDLSNDNIDYTSKIFTLSLQEIKELYKSKIIQFVLSDSLTKYLSSSSIINNEVLYSNYVMTTNYDGYPYIKTNELANLKNAFTLLGITNQSSLETNANFDTLYKKLSNPSTLDGVYESYIIRGIVTKSLLDNPNVQSYHHELALETDCEIYKKSEIEAFIKIMGDSLSSFDPSKLTLSELKGYIYDQDGKTKSYLIVKAISEVVCDLDTINIPKLALDNRIKDNTNILHPQQLGSLISGLIAFGINDFTSAPTLGTQLSAQQTKAICDSDILRATFTSKIKITGRNVVCLTDRCSKVTTLKGNEVAMLSSDEFSAFMDAVNIISNGNIDFSLNISIIIGLNSTQKDIVLSSSIACHAVSELLFEYATSFPLINTAVTALRQNNNFYVLATAEIKSLSTLSKGNVITILNTISH